MGGEGILDGLRQRLGLKPKPNEVGESAFIPPETDWKTPEVVAARLLQNVQGKSDAEIAKQTLHSLRSFKDAVILDQMQEKYKAAVAYDTTKETIETFNEWLRLLLNNGSPTVKDRTQLAVALASTSQEKVTDALNQLDFKYRHDPAEFTDEDKRNIRDVNITALKIQALAQVDNLIKDKLSSVDENGNPIIGLSVLNDMGKYLKEQVNNRFTQGL